jgi:hypothetical protein
MKTSGQRHYSLWQIFRWPLLIGLLSAIGLVSALVGDDLWDAISWATLAVPVTVTGWGMWRKQ